MVQLFRKRYTRGHKTSENQEDSALKIGLLCDKIMGKCCRRAVSRLSFCYQNKMVSKQ